MAIGERISQQPPISGLAELNVQAWLVGDFNVTAPGTGTTKRFNKEQLAQALLNTGPIGDAIRSVLAATERLVGYLSPSPPADVSVQDGMYWKVSGAAGKPPAAFPWSGLYKRVNGQWAQTGELYTPLPFDMWANTTDHTGYYWFDNAWNIRDVNVDGITVRHNPNTQLIEIAPGGVNASHIASALINIIYGALQRSGGVMTGEITLPSKPNYSSAGYAASIGDIEALDLGAMDYVGNTDPVTVFGPVPPGTRWLNTAGSTIGTRTAGGVWSFAAVKLINGLHANGVFSGDIAGYKKEARYSRASNSWVLYSTADVTPGQLAAEAAARQSADNALSAAIQTEAAARQSADNTLSTAIQAEAADRESADTALSGDIAAEAIARQSADNAHAALTQAHGSAAVPAADHIAMYGNEGGLKSDKTPAQDNDVIRKIEMDTETARAQAAEGNLADLTTACKTSLTAAVNELASELDSFPAAVQTLGGEYLIGNFAGAYITALQ